MGLENVGDRRIRYAVPQIRHRSLNPVIAPCRTFLRQPQYQFDDLRCNRRTSTGFPATAVVPVPGHQFAMPAENRIWSRDVGQMLEHLPSENPAFDGQAPPLVVVEQDSTLSELLSQNPILGKEVLDGVLLSAVDPAGEDQEQQMPRLKLRPHVSPGVCG